jgi:hypothetical protein
MNKSIKHAKYPSGQPGGAVNVWQPHPVKGSYHANIMPPGKCAPAAIHKPKAQYP